LLGIASAALAAACAHDPPAPAKEAGPCTEPEKLRVLVDGAKDLNRGPGGQPLPTVVRIYQLKGTAQLGVVSLDEIMRNEKAALVDDLLEVQEITLKPNARVYPELRRLAGATHIAVAGFFRQPTADSWRAITALPPSDPFLCHKKDDGRPWMQFFLHGYQVDFRSVGPE
jgi:type VI secretion system VasD/TssJ family lipoprotein